jgi:deoxyribodipyrimidine photolyase-related protein
MHITLIYPHQLFLPHPALQLHHAVWLIEDPLFFGDKHHPATFHKMKLVLHRASLKRYQHEVLAQYRTHYVDYGALIGDSGALFAQLVQAGATQVHVCDPVDFILEKRIRRYCTHYGLNLVWYDTLNFITTSAQIQQFYASKSTYHQTDFYVWQRKTHAILLDKGKPLGGKWTYDSDNRQKLKSNVALPTEPKVYENPFVREAQAYVQQHFAKNYGECYDFIYPTNHAEAQTLLHDFLRVKLGNFGAYQDAISERGAFLFHSLLSSSINIGLLSPMQVITTTLAFYDEHPHISLASIEGFVRQIIGWREFMRAVYVREGVKERNSNFWGQNRALDARWYNGTLGIPPVDAMIKKMLRYAYAHHIERLMLAGNLMVLCEIHPNEVYRWFMELFIDAYDWVMVPNVYGMSQYADGGLITTKPYISSSNYVRKMSDYKEGDWSKTWDALYWRFIHKHSAFFRANPRLAMMTTHLDRMDDDMIKTHDYRAETFLRG